MQVGLGENTPTRKLNQLIWYLYKQTRHHRFGSAGFIGLIWILPTTSLSG